MTDITYRDEAELCFNLLIVLIPIFIITALVYVILKIVIKRKENFEKEKYTKVMNVIAKILFIIAMIILISLSFINADLYEFPTIVMNSVIILCFVATILRIKNNKKTAYIIVIISVILLIVTGLYCNITEDTRLKQYYKSFYKDEDEHKILHKYEGTQKGSVIPFFISEVLIINNFSDSKKISVSGVVSLDENDEEVHYNEIIKKDAKYLISLTYDEDGYVTSATIENYN